MSNVLTRKGRYSTQAQQEDVSLGQVKARLAAHGWPADKLERDLGEDFIVQIYDEGRASGLDFYLQVKSTAAINVVAKKGASYAVYPIKVSDLEHWLVIDRPVVLLV